MRPTNRTGERAVRAFKTSLLFCCVGLFAAGQNHAKEESLLIGPGDQLHVQVFATPDLEQHPRVTDAGDVPLMLLGNVHVAGLTPAQAATTIAKDLIAGIFLLHPQVTVTVEQFATQGVTVLGQVKQPGTFPVTAPRSIFDMIAMAGGLTDVADRSITIERKSDPDRRSSSSTPTTPTMRSTTACWYIQATRSWFRRLGWSMCSGM